MSGGCDRDPNDAPQPGREATALDIAGERYRKARRATEAATKALERAQREEEAALAALGKAAIDG